MADDIKKIFSERLRQLMWSSVPRVTSAALANALGLSTASTNSYLAAGSSPTLTTLANISKYFNTTADYLLGLTDEPRPLGVVESKTVETTDEPSKPWKPKSICKNCKWRIRADVPSGGSWDGTVCGYTLQTGNFRETAVTDTHCDYFEERCKNDKKAESYPFS